MTVRCLGITIAARKIDPLSTLLDHLLADDGVRSTVRIGLGVAMLIMVGVVCLIAGLVGGFVAGANLAASAYKDDLRLLANQKLEDQISYFGALRREIANILITDNPRQFLKLYQRIHFEMSKIETSDKASKDARLTLIAQRYPYINEFDPFQTKDYVLYADT